MSDRLHHAVVRRGPRLHPGAEIVVYVDGVRSGGPQTLEAVTALAVMEIRYINAADATTRFGTGHPLGAIVVLTKR